MYLTRMQLYKPIEIVIIYATHHAGPFAPARHREQLTQHRGRARVCAQLLQDVCNRTGQLGFLFDHMRKVLGQRLQRKEAVAELI